jgi:putative toxin-antitoxin system antitoxin component (TIGR02293 family)
VRTIGGIKKTNYFCGKKEKMKAYKSKDSASTFTISESATAYGLITNIREGLPFQYFVGLVERLPLTIREWARVLHLSERSLQRYQKSQKAFDSMQSERIIEITLLSNYGKSVFGSDANWVLWLSQNNVALGGITPKSLLDSSIGIQLLRDELGRIEQGIFA